MRMNAAETRASSAIAVCTPLAVVPRSLTTAEIDTFMSDVSTTSTNMAMASSSPRRISPWLSPAADLGISAAVALLIDRVPSCWLRRVGPPSAGSRAPTVGRRGGRRRPPRGMSGAPFGALLVGTDRAGRADGVHQERQRVAQLAVPVVPGVRALAVGVDGRRNAG